MSDNGSENPRSKGDDYLIGILMPLIVISPYPDKPKVIDKNISFCGLPIPHFRWLLCHILPNLLKSIASLI